MKLDFHRLPRDIKRLTETHRAKLPYLIGAFACLMIYALSHSRETSVQIYKTEGAPEYKETKIFGSQEHDMYEGKERLMGKTLHELLEAQTVLREANQKLQSRLEGLEKDRSPKPSPTPSSSTSLTTVGQSPEIGARDQIQVSQASPGFEGGRSPRTFQEYGSYGAGSSRSRNSGEEGRAIISFPVKDVPNEHLESIVLPAGSYVKAKLMTGIEAPEGKTYPVLLQLDYAFIVPNKRKVDLTGCFMIAKSQGDLSTERVQMQATKLSCVSKDGRMFEREVNGYIADDVDNSFAVMGSVNSKQDRVAAMAFLSSIVEGVGKALQQAQTTQQTTPLGGSQSVLTGNQAEYMGAGGAANAAGLVTQFYLKEAQNLLPTIAVGSGHEIWVVMQDTVKLPSSYFHQNKKGATNENSYTYLSGVLD